MPRTCDETGHRAQLLVSDEANAGVPPDGMDRGSIHYFRGNLPDSVPRIASAANISALVRNTDCDYLSVVIETREGCAGFLVTQLVILNMERDEGFYFRGLNDPDGMPLVYSTARSVISELRAIVQDRPIRFEYVQILKPGASGADYSFSHRLEGAGETWGEFVPDERLDTSLIPEGFYCTGCPYHSLRADKPEQENGYCAFMEIGDWTSKFTWGGLLWDDLKICGINEP